MSRYGKRWTDEHTRVMLFNRQAGFKGIHKKLLQKFGEDWSRAALWKKAHANMIEVGVAKREIPLVWLLTRKERKNGLEAHPLIIKRAKEEGVARRTLSHGNKICVPEWWADKIMNELEEHGEDYVLRRNRKHKRSQKLNEKQAKTILALKGKRSHGQLAKQFNVTKGAIRAIQTGRTWKHLHAKQK